MKSISILLLLSIVLVGYATAQSEQCAYNCTNGVENDIFSGETDYLTWGLSKYVRDANTPPIKAVHPTSVKTAIIVIHGNNRDAYNYFCYMSYAVDLQGNKNSTYIVAPHFYLYTDVGIPANAFFWVNSLWREGARSHSTTSRIASFQILDNMIAQFNNKDYFPGLEEVLVVGHSAGGQTVQRYAVASGVDTTYTNVRYVVENAGSFAYLDTSRATLPILNNTCTACVASEITTNQYSFALVNRTGEQSCTTYNDWRMGLDAGNVYLDRRTAAEIRSAYKLKNVWYLVGTNDTCNTAIGPNCGCTDNSLDTNCDAEMQGYCRFQRGVIFFQYLKYYYGTEIHKMSYVEDIAHDGCKMITSSPSLRAMFPSEYTTTTTTTAGSTTTGDATTGGDSTSTTSDSTTGIDFSPLSSISSALYAFVTLNLAALAFVFA